MKQNARPSLGAHVLGVDVNGGVDVVDQVPTFVIGIVVDHEVIAVAVPAPIRSNIPIPGSNCKGKTAWKPEAVMVAVKAFDAISIRRAKVLKAAVFERMVDDIAAVVGPGAAEPMGVAGGRGGVGAGAFAGMGFRVGRGVP